MKVIQRAQILLVKHYKSLLKLAFAVALSGLILYEGHEQIQSIHPATTLHTLRSIPLTSIGEFFILGIIASVSMVLYDVFGMKAFRYDIERKDLFSISFLSNSVNTLLGFGGLTGSSVKSLLLKRQNIEFKETLPYNTLLVTSATTGLSFMIILSLTHFSSIAPLVNQHKWLMICLIGFSCYLPIYFFLEKMIKPLRGWASSFGVVELLVLRFKLLGVSILEWFLAAFLFYKLSSYFQSDLSYLNLLSIFAIASVAGILSFMPGGVGSFDLIAIMGLQFMGLTDNEALTVVILYRVFYFILPSCAAIINFSLHVLRKSEQRGYVIKSQLYGQLIATVMAILISTCGLLLLLSALTPSLISRSKLITNTELIVLLQYSRSISIAIGFMLLFLTKDIFFRVKKAYHATMILLLAGGIFTFIKGLDFEEFFFLLIAMGILRLSKTNFYRKSILVKPSHIVAIILSVPLLLTIYLKISHFLFSSYIKTFHYPHLVFHDISAFIHSGILAYLLFIGFLILWTIKRDRIEKDPLFQCFDNNKVDQFFENNKGHHLSHLIYLGDKHLFWLEDQQVLIAYSLFSDKAVVLGDPMGENSHLSNGIQEFQKFVDTYGYRAVFYEVDEDKLSTYHDNGFFFFKLGEEAIVDLQKFDMVGSSRRTFRNVVKRFEKDGYTFEVMAPPFTDSLLNELGSISEEWLGKRKEMGFSVGWFRKDYLQKAPLAVLRQQSNDEIIAFVSMTLQGNDSEHIGIDLMRFRSSVPNSTMDFMFIQLLLHFKEQGYHFFSLGVAPLSQVGLAIRSHRVEKIAHFIYEHGKPIYSFEGLRKFKDKFDPKWAPRYLAYPQLVSLPALLIELSMLVNLKKK